MDVASYPFYCVLRHIHRLAGYFPLPGNGAYEEDVAHVAALRSYKAASAALAASNPAMIAFSPNSKRSSASAPVMYGATAVSTGYRPGGSVASVADHEVGSASGVLNAAQQLASAIGVAAIGTVFFAALARSGYTAAIRQCLIIELGIAAVLFVLARALPRRPRDPQTAEIEPATADTSVCESLSGAGLL